MEASGSLRRSFGLYVLIKHRGHNGNGKDSQATRGPCRMSIAARRRRSEDRPERTVTKCGRRRTTCVHVRDHHTILSKIVRQEKLPAISYAFHGLEIRRISVTFSFQHPLSKSRPKQLSYEKAGIRIRILATRLLPYDFEQIVRDPCYRRERGAHDRAHALAPLSKAVLR